MPTPTIEQVAERAARELQALREDVTQVINDLNSAEIELAKWREFGATFLNPEWEKIDNGGSDGIRHWEECVECGATRNDTRNGSNPPRDNVNGHYPYCPSVVAARILNIINQGAQ